MIIEAAEMATKLATEAYVPIGEAGEQMLERFTREELELALRFVKEATEVQRRFLESPGSSGNKPQRRRKREQG